MRNAFLLVIFICLFLVGCKENKKPQTNNTEVEDEIAVEVNKGNNTPLTVQLINQDGMTIGEAVLVEDKRGVIISTEATDLPPGLHGYHIHEHGLCETPDFETAGGHFNPDDKEHGFDHENGPHAGDLPNLNVEDDGTVKDQYINNRVTLVEGEDHSLRGTDGTTLIIHSDPDDYISQPAGDAGDRIACGVISKPH